MTKRLKLLASMSLFTPLSFAISCAQLNQEANLYQYIDKDHSIDFQDIDPDKATTKSIINNILSRTYKTNVERTQFVNQQTDPVYIEKLEAEIQDLSNKFGAAKKENQILVDVKNKLFELYSKNWYYFLNNYNKYVGLFEEFIAIPDAKDGVHSENYKKLIASSRAYQTVKFNNNNIQNIRIGEESAELRDTTVLYLQLNKVVLKLVIREASSQNPQLFISPEIWYFGASKAKTVSLSLVSYIYHNGFIHKYQEGYDALEKDLVVNQRHGLPAYVMLVLPNPNDQNTENTNVENNTDLEGVWID
ncbi:aromatic motif membrane protein [Mycoplasma corogypsi]|uniref:aromatic motif membrane protein n=1 Tax=Mycoplasma corogypsi TaxID=2106 RepID=UPI003872F6FD